MVYIVVKSSSKRIENGSTQKNDKVASFQEETLAEEYAKALGEKEKLDEYGGIARFWVHEAPDTPIQLAPVESPEFYKEVARRMTVKDAIELAIKAAGGRISLDEIYARVNEIKKLASKTPDDTIRSELYRGIPNRFQRNADGTYSLATPGEKIAKAKAEARHPLFSTPNSGFIINGIPFSLYNPKEAELEKAFTQNYRALFGPGSFYVPIKKLVGSANKRVTDGLLLDLNDFHKAKFRIVELETGEHKLQHIRDQVMDFLLALGDPETLTKLVKEIDDYVRTRVEADDDASDWWLNYMHGGDPDFESFKFIHELLHNKKDRGVAIVIDESSPQIKSIVEFLSSKSGSVKIVVLKFYRTQGIEVYYWTHSDTKDN